MIAKMCSVLYDWSVTAAAYGDNFFLMKWNRDVISKDTARYSFSSVIPSPLSILAPFFCPTLAMSVAAALALARQQVPRTHTAPTHPRAEAAAIAINGLESLSSIDPVLSTLSTPLLLLAPHKDRTTLPPPEAEALSAASVTLIRRLAPILPLRHAQKVLQWPLQHLQLGVAGGVREINALLVAALPFHATEEFVAIVREGLKKKRQKWKWLEGVVAQKKPANLEFMRQRCTMQAVWMVVEELVAASNEGINVKPLAGFMASVVVWRVANIGERDRRYTVLRLVRAMEQIKGKKGSGSEAICALMICVAVAAERGVDGDVRTVAGRAMALALVEDTEAVRKTSIECLQLLVERGLEVIPRDAATKVLLNSRVLEEAGERICEACVLGLLEGKVRHKTFQRMSNGMGYLGMRGVRNVIVKLLDLFSATEKGDREEGDVRVGLIRMLSNLARGKFAEGIDGALREHFAKRKTKKPERYEFVDGVLAEALAGTSYEVLKKKIGENVAVGTLVGMLAHPEPVVRIAALDRIKGNEQVRKEGNVDGVLVKRCLDLGKHDPDISVAANAVECLLQLQNDGRLADIDINPIVERYRAERVFLRKRTKKTKSRTAGLDAFTRQIIFACQQYHADHPLKIKSLLVGLLLGNDFAEQVTRIDQVDNIKGILRTLSSETEIGSVELDEDENICNSLKTWLRARILEKGWNCLPFIKALTSWESQWAVSVLCLWFEHLTEEGGRRDDVFGYSLLEAVKYLCDQNVCGRESISVLLKNAVIPCCKSTEGKESEMIAGQIWDLTTTFGNETVVTSVLKSMCTSIGVDRTIGALRRAVASSSDKHQISSVKSLRWFIGLSQCYPSEQIRKQAIFSMLCALFGNDESMRQETLRLCAKDPQISIGKKSMGDFQKLRRAVREVMGETTSRVVFGDSRHFIDDADTGVDLTSATLLSLRRQNGHPPPLSRSVFAQAACAKIFQWTLKRICHDRVEDSERLFLLRAVQGFKDIGEREAGELLCLLQKVLDTELLPNVRSELVFRMSSMVASQEVIQKLHRSLDKNIVLQSVEYFAQKLEVMEDESSPDQRILPDLQQSVVLATGQLFNLCGSKGGEGTGSHQLLFGLLLAVSVKSSPGGRFARRFLDEVCADHVNYLVPFIARFVAKKSMNIKRQRITKEKSSELLDRVPVVAGVGAIETLGRMTSSVSSLFEKRRSVLHEIMSLLWNFITNAMSKCVGGVKFLEEEDEYQVQTVMTVLASLHHDEVASTAATGLFTECDFSALTTTIFYAGLLDRENQTALRLSVGRASLKLADILTTVHREAMGSALADKVEKFIAKEASLSPSFLHTLVPTLLKCGSDFRKVCSWMSQAAFHVGRKSGTLAEHRQLIASCCDLTDDKQVASTVCLQEFSRQAVKFLPLSVAAEECGHLTLSTNSNVAIDLTTITEASEIIRCELALVYLLHAKFQSKLRVEMNGTEQGEGLISGFSGLYQALLQASKTHEDESIVAILGLLPLSFLTVCIVESIKRLGSSAMERALAALLARLKAFDIELSHSWNVDEVDPTLDHLEQLQSTAGFFTRIGDELYKIVLPHAGESNENLELYGHESTRLALECLDVLVERVGSSSEESLVKFSGAPLSVIRDQRCSKAVSDPNCDENYSTIVSTALRCMATVIRTLGKLSVVFVPQTVVTSVNILQSIANGNEISSVGAKMMDAAVVFCNTVLESIPKVFGHVAIQNIAKLVLSTNSRVCNEILILAMQRVPTSISLASLHAITGKLSNIQVNAQGIAMLLTAFSVMVESTSRIELRAQVESFIRISLNCVDFINSGDESMSEGLVLPEATPENAVKMTNRRQACLLIDNAFTEAMMKIILKISETDFKDLFKKLVQWVDGGCLPEYVSAVVDLNRNEIFQNSLRAIPFFRLSRRLLQVLRTLYVPYFFQLLDQVLSIVDGGRICSIKISSTEEINGEAMQKKRRRSQFEEDDVTETQKMVLAMKEELYDEALNNLILFLQQELNSIIVTPAVVGKIQASLIGALDKEGKSSEEITSAFVALGNRIVSVGSQKESREESRDLLVSLSRDILSRTRHAEFSVRKASLTLSKSLAVVIGDEYLVTLPESMPMLSEVIDDENSEVRSAAKAFVQEMESLAGESMMENLK